MLDRAWEIMKTTIKRAFTVAAVTAVLVASVFGTPEVLTRAIMFIVPFVVTFLVLVILLRRPAVTAWPLAQQRTVTWLVAASTGVCVGLFPRALAFLAR